MKKWKLPVNKLSSSLQADPNFLRLLAIYAVIFLFISIAKGGEFLKLSMFVSMSVQLPEYAILALCVSLTLISGGIDLSVVGIANLSGIIMALFMNRFITDTTAPGIMILLIIAAILLGILLGLICGMINGILISYFQIPAILATMGTMQMFMGLAIIITHGEAVISNVPAFTNIMNASLANLFSVPLIIFILCALIVSFTLRRTNYGQKLYLVGTNMKCAYFSGIKINLVILKTYIFSGTLAVMTAVIMLGRNASAKADTGLSYTLQCVLIAVLGGVKTEGGFGKVCGIVIAAIILQTTSTALNLFRNINNFYRSLIWGSVLIIVLITNFLIDKNRNSPKRSKKNYDTQRTC